MIGVSSVAQHTLIEVKKKFAANCPRCSKIALLINSELFELGCTLANNCLVVGRTELLQGSQNHLLYMPSTLSTSVEISLYNTNVYTLIFEVAIVAIEQNAALKPASVFTKWRLGA